ncbi:MAG TPA: glycosyltransferase family 2 protein [Anaerolineae bacterium]|nr:glycosyltransferase family 2 protein [Anaerolineae bacterium]
MPETPLPFVSVVMPVRNEVAFVERSLGAVLAQDYPADRMEVIVVDGCSVDGTLEILKRYQAADPRLVILSNPAQIVPPALNIGIRHARGDVVIRVDGHTVIAPDYVRKCVEYLQRDDVDNVGGLMRPVGETYFGRAVALATSSPFGIGNSKFHYSEKEQSVDTVYLGAYPRQVFDRIGLFDERFVVNQDYELNYRLRAAGGRILCTPEIRSVYYCRESPAALGRQYFRYGFWKVHTLRKHPRSLKIRHLAAPTLVAGIVTLAILGLGLQPMWYLLALGAALYLALAAAFAFARVIKTRSLDLWPGVVIAFLTLHLAWGTGFWVGVLRSLLGLGSGEDPPREPTRSSDQTR